MDQLIAWCGFAGGWLLVAGPLYQAAVELADGDLRRDEMLAATKSVERPADVSPWWWLLPPVGYLLRRRRDRRYRTDMLRALAPRQVEQLVDFGNKATGWLFVASGAFLIAVKETWELHESAEWPLAAFWVVVAVMPFLAFGYTAVRMSRGRDMVAFAAGETD